MPIQRLPGGTPRNALCPCGSGSKYKKCCLPADQSRVPVQARRAVKPQKHYGPRPREVFDTLEAVRAAAASIQIVATGSVPGEIADRSTVCDAMRRAGVEPRFIYAYEQTGLLLTSINKAVNLPEDVARWDAAVETYEQQHPEEDREDIADCPPGADGPRTTSGGNDGGVQAGSARLADDAGPEDADPSRPPQAGGDAGVP